MPSIKLTQKLIDTFAHSSTGNKTNYFDTTTKGFALEVRTNGKTYFITYRNERGLKKQHSIGCASILKLNDARNLAQQYLSQIAQGQDPFAKKAELKQVPTVADFINESYIPFAKTYKRSWNTDESLTRNHIIPAFGSKHMDSVNKGDIITFIAKHHTTHAPSSINRVIILMRYIFNCAIRWETPGISKNPTADTPLLEENNKLERFLTEVEAQALLLATRESENTMLQHIVAMLILTGARKREVLDAKWSELDLERRSWRIGMSKSGKARYVPISDGVMRILESVPQYDGVDCIFVNPKTLKPYVSIFNSWDTARKKAGLDKVRIHDLRHSFASFLVNSGRSLYEVQKMLGHTQIKTTQRYAHLSNDRLLDAANHVSKLVPLTLAMPNTPSDVKMVSVTY